MHFRSVWRLLAAGCLALSTVAAGSGLAQAAGPPGWQIKQISGSATHLNEVASVSAVSASDAWFAGFTCLQLPCDRNGFARTAIFVEHWNGHRLSTIAIPRRWAYGNDVTVLHIGADSASDAWVFTMTPGRHFWALHWSGRHWTRMPIPAFTTSPMVFGPDNIWTFSKLRTSGAVEEYRAHRWHRVRLSWKPQTATALSSHNIWALAQSKAGEALLMHWNGRSWHRTQITIHGSAQNMTADSARNVWVESEDQVSQGWFYNWHSGAVSFYPGGAAGTTYEPRGPVASDGMGGMWTPAPGITSPGGTGLCSCVEEFDFFPPASVNQVVGPIPTENNDNDPAHINALANQPGTNFEWAVGYERPPQARGTKAMIWIFN